MHSTFNRRIINRVFRGLYRNKKEVALYILIGYIIYSIYVDGSEWMDYSGFIQNARNTISITFQGPPFDLEAMRCRNCTVVDYPIRLAPHCSSVFLLALVASRVANKDQRNVIRDTWGRKNSSDDVRTIFVLGHNKSEPDRIRQEHTLHQDILQFDFMDTYTNLTLKTLSGLQWILHNCPDVKYILKTDDDSFNNIPEIIRHLKTNKYKDSISGRCFTVRPSRDNSSRYFVPVHTYPYPYFPVYCGGPSYLIPVDILQTLLDTSKHVKLFPSEDTYMTGFVRHVAGIPYRQLPRCAVPASAYFKMSNRQRAKVTSVHDLKRKTHMMKVWKYYSS